MLEVAEALSFTAGFLVSLSSLLVLISPRWLGITHRIYAIPLAFTFAGFVAAFSVVAPQWLGDGDLAGTRVAGAIMMAIWGITIWFAMLVARRTKDQSTRPGFWKGLYTRWGYTFSFKEMKARQQQAAPFGIWAEIKSGWIDPAHFEEFIAALEAKGSRRRAEFENRQADRTRAKQVRIAAQAQRDTERTRLERDRISAQAQREAEKQRLRDEDAAREEYAGQRLLERQEAERQETERQERERYLQQVAEAKIEVARVQLLNQAELEGKATQRRIDSMPSPPIWANTDDRLGLMFDNYRAGSATLDEYEAAIKAEAESIKERAAELRANRKLHGKDYCEAEKEQLDEDRDAVQWRRRWLSDERHRAKNSRPGFAPSGKWSRFEYVDADGVITKRNVVNWERRGAYIVGYDKDRREERTFRQDRISDWLSG